MSDCVSRNPSPLGRPAVAAEEECVWVQEAGQKGGVPGRRNATAFSLASSAEPYLPSQWVYGREKLPDSAAECIAQPVGVILEPR